MLGSLGPMHGRVNGGGTAEVILTTVELLKRFFSVERQRVMCTVAGHKDAALLGGFVDRLNETW